MIRTIVSALAAALALCLGGFVPAEATTPDSPFIGRQLYVIPDTSAKNAVLQDPASASTITEIANTPQAMWLTPTTASVEQTVRSTEEAAGAAGAVPVFTIYGIPNRDCGSYSAGGFSTGGEYAVWIDHIAAGIGSSSAVVILEPDAVTATDCLSFTDLMVRASLLKYAVRKLTASPNTNLYVDGGHSRWLKPQELADRLSYLGIDKARGFSLNVSNFYTTSEEIAYGEKVSALLGGKAYVVDTSRNGNGPASDEDWCNPSGRALGERPTADTAGAHADAYLWIKHPGESDGTCAEGDPQSGMWFNSYAVSLVAN